MKNEPNTGSKKPRPETTFESGTRLVAQATAGDGLSAQVNRAVYGESYAEFGAIRLKEMKAEQWTNPDRFVFKLGELRGGTKPATGEQK